MKQDEISMRHMLDAISKIEQLLNGMTYEQFINDMRTMYAIICLFAILGEAAGKLSKEFCNKYPSIPFAQIISMKNYLIHQYDEVDLKIVWSAYRQHLPSLKKELTTALES
jgi:uncharacterized protein with HEPN domain